MDNEHDAKDMLMMILNIDDDHEQGDVLHFPIRQGWGYTFMH